MPLKKYRSVDEMEDRLWVQPGTPEHRDALRRVFEIAAVFGSQKHAPCGVFKYRSIEEAGAHRETWERLAREKLDRQSKEVIEYEKDQSHDS